MKATHGTDRTTIERFEEIVNVGPAVARDLKRLGFRSPPELIGADAVDLYRKLCAVTKTRQDPCVLDVFLAVVDYMNGNAPRPWWHYTVERKAKWADVVADPPSEWR